MSCGCVTYGRLLGLCLCCCALQHRQLGADKNAAVGKSFHALRRRRVLRSESVRSHVLAEKLGLDPGGKDEVKEVRRREMVVVLLLLLLPLLCCWLWWWCSSLWCWYGWCKAQDVKGLCWYHGTGGAWANGAVRELRWWMPRTCH